MTRAMSSSTRRPEPIHLDFRTKGGQVIVAPNDEDRFSLTIQEAAMACKAGQKQVLFGRQFERGLLPKLAVWTDQNQEKLERAYLTLGDGRLLFLVVRKNVPFDSEFEDRLSDLDLQIAQDEELGLIHLSVLALPKVSRTCYESFLDTRMTLEYGGLHGD
ncbi:MAG: hypothetical protein PHU85_19320 [Phycisphaerae bacterium]|nr:hypothetical protein [Phycisphaerae bacterium]